MICPLYQRAQTQPHDPYLILQDRQISFLEMHLQACSCEDHLQLYDQNTPLAIDSHDPFHLLAWLYAAARTGHWIAIPSTKDPLEKRDHILKRLAIRTESLYWKLPPPKLLIEQTDTHTTIASIKSRWCMLFTSGSSGQPKAVVHSFSSLWAAVIFSDTNIAFRKGDRWLLSLFLWHIGGLMIPLRALYGGSSIVQKDPSITIGAQISHSAITHLSLVATQLHDLLQDTHDLSSLKAILVGGGTIPSKLIEKSKTIHLPIHTTYGMTELGSQLSTTPPNATLSTLQSAGYLLGDWQLRIDEDEQIFVQGSPLFLGYWNGSIIEDPRDPAGWFGTGDRGYLQNKKLYPIGRVDQMFISGGENIHPEEIEAVLHDQGIFSIVVPIPNDRYGSRPVAFILHDLSTEIVDKISQIFHDTLPKFKHPDHILPWPPEVSTYKPSRRALQKIATDTLNTTI